LRCRGWDVIVAARFGVVCGRAPVTTWGSWADLSVESMSLKAARPEIDR
jgi:hypothetical protein